MQKYVIPFSSMQTWIDDHYWPENVQCTSRQDSKFGTLKIITLAVLKERQEYASPDKTAIWFATEFQLVLVERVVRPHCILIWKLNIFKLTEFALLDSHMLNDKLFHGNGLSIIFF